jgi:predicted nucleic acid-binding protein
MRQKNPRVFLDSSVVFAAVLSPTGGARKLFLLGEAGLLCLVVGPTVLRECEEVVRRKIPVSLSTLAQLLSNASLETSPTPNLQQIAAAEVYVQYTPEAHVLAEAILARPNWFVTHDKEHFLKHRNRINPPFEIVTPGNLLQHFKDDFIQP